jgi:hypothetical protein
MDENDKQQILAQIHRGMPDANVEFGDTLDVNPDQKAPAEEVEAAPMRISLDNIDVNIHNQSFGMISASTGCISNPGGPSC